MPTAVAIQSVQVSNNSKAQAVAKAQAIALQGYENQSKFNVDGVLFDMVRPDPLNYSRLLDIDSLLTRLQDGTLTDSIAAVEAAWTAKAHELGMDPAFVIAATHGRRASDNLQELIPSLKPHHVDGEVDSESMLPPDLLALLVMDLHPDEVRR